MSGRSIFSKGDSKPQTGHEEISAFLGKEAFFEGKMTFRGIFRLDGRFEGEVLDSGTLIVGETATVKGRISLHTIIINGHVEGELHAAGRVEIHSTGTFTGTLLTPKLIVHEGGVLNGHCAMRAEPSEADRPPSQAPQVSSTLSVS